MRGRVVAVLAAMFMAVPVLAQSKASYVVRAGLLSPSGKFAEYATGGWMGSASLSAPLGQSRWSLEPTVFYGHATHEGNDGDASSVMGGAVGFRYALSSGTVTPYLSTLSGMLRQTFDTDNTGPLRDPDTQVLLGLGGGLGLAMGGTQLFLDARYIHAENTRFMAFTVGLGLGGGVRR